ncbi:MAG: DnaD domain protein [Clostridiaceae bacterium]|nr:DnaD domain protein [Clostridiaceae bacterium]
MRIVRNRNSTFSDTAVPDLFIHDFMLRLDGDAVKCYLLLLSVAENGSRIISSDDMAARLGFSAKKVAELLQQLQSEGLISVSQQDIRLEDIKAKELERRFRPKETAPPSDIIEREKEHEGREQIVNEINMTFFQGTMTYTWYELIDYWFDHYGFEPAVMYSLFQEAANANALRTTAYIRRIAEDWSQAGIKTYDQLSVYYERFLEKKQLQALVAKNLRRRLSEPDNRLISNWMDEYGYAADIVEQALEKLTGASNPSVKYLDSILSEWHAQGLQTVEEILEYEQKYQQRQAAKRKSEQKVSGDFTMSEESLTEVEQISQDLAGRIPRPRLKKSDSAVKKE